MNKETLSNVQKGQKGLSERIFPGFRHGFSLRVKAIGKVDCGIGVGLFVGLFIG
jgi:hypothetical protein